MISVWFFLIFILFIFNDHVNDIKKRLTKKIIMMVGNQLNEI